MRAVWLLIAAGCGRIGFEPSAGTGASSTLLLDRYDAGETLLDFPLCLVLDDTRLASELVQADGSDLRLYDDTGTALPIELEKAALPFIAWTRVPRITGTTTRLTLRYGDPDAPAPTEQVWDASYEAIWHFGETPRDSTSNGHHGVATGSVVGEGFRGNGWQFDGSSVAVIKVPDTSWAPLTQITVSGLVFVRSHPQAFTAVAGRQFGNTASNDFYLGTYMSKLHIGVSTPSNFFTEDGTTVVTDGTWHFLALTYDGARLRGYVDGAPEIDQPATGSILHSASNPLRLGADNNDADTTLTTGDFLDGGLDEVRIERVARSSAWLGASQISIGDEWITYGSPVFD